MQGRAVVAGIGESDLLRARASRRYTEFQLALHRDPRGLRRRRPRARRGRRLRVVHGPAQRPAAARGRARREALSLDLAALGRRRQQHGGGRAARRRRGLGRLRAARRRVPRARAGAVRPLRAVAAARAASAATSPGRAPVRAALAGAGVRAAHDALHARPRHLAGGALRDRARLPTPTPSATRARSATASRSTREAYHASRWIVEPFHLYDCCPENDGAAAIVVTTPERARDLAAKPVAIVAAAQGLGPPYGVVRLPGRLVPGRHYRTSPRSIWERAGCKPADVDVLQLYENFTGPVLMALCELGFAAPEEVEEFVAGGAARRAGRRAARSTPAAATSARRTSTASRW